MLHIPAHVLGIEKYLVWYKSASLFILVAISVCDREYMIFTYDHAACLTLSLILILAETASNVYFRHTRFQYFKHQLH